MLPSENQRPPQPVVGPAVPHPPTSNTGGKLTISLDWLRVVFESKHFDGLVAYLTRIWGEPVERSGHFFQAKSLQWETGASLHYSPGGGILVLEMPGGAMRFIREEDYAYWVELLGVHFRGEATRVDIAADDPSKSIINLDEAAASLEAREFCHFKHGVTLKPVSPTTGEVIGYSVTLGKRGGDGRQVQFYDKTLESEGEIDCNRLEVRWSGESAKAAWALLVSCADKGNDAVTRCMAGMVGGAAEVRKRVEGVQHIARREELTWWARIKLELGRVAVKVHRAKSSLQRRAEYVVGVFSKPLGRLLRVIEDQGHDGDRWLRDILHVRVQEDRNKRGGSAIEIELPLLSP